MLAVKLLIAVLLSGSFAKADSIISAAVKYGPSGYTTTGTSSSSSVTKNKVTSTTVTNGVVVQSQSQAVAGIRYQYVTSVNVVMGVGYFVDSTSEVSVGFRF